LQREHRTSMPLTDSRLAYWAFAIASSKCFSQSLARVSGVQVYTLSLIELGTFLLRRKERRPCSVPYSAARARDHAEARSPQNPTMTLRALRLCARNRLQSTPGRRFADLSFGCLSSTRNANRSTISCGESCFSKPSGMSESSLSLNSSMSSRGMICS